MLADTANWMQDILQLPVLACHRTHQPPLSCPQRSPARAADAGSISIGDKTNVQDGCVIRTAPGSLSGHAADTTIGRAVTIGHQASLHGCTVGDRALIGMSATLLEGSTVRWQGSDVQDAGRGTAWQRAGQAADV